MTESEAFEYLLMAKANAVTTFTVYFTFTFAYLAAAYFVGTSLTRLQAFTVSGMYIISAMSAVLTHQSDLSTYKIAMDNAGEYRPQDIFSDPDFWSIYIGILLLAGIAVSLYFMWSVRHPKTE